MDVRKLMPRTISTLIVVLSAAFLPLVAKASVPPGYKVFDLGEVTITGGGAIDVNESGQVAVNLAGTAFVWSAGTLSPPGGLPNNNTSFAINDNANLTWTLNQRAQYWDGTSQSQLPRLENGLTAGHDINIHSHIVGTSRRDSINATRGFLWDGNTMVDLGSLQANGESRALAINDSGVIAGGSNSTDVPVKWVAGAITPLPLLPAATTGLAHDINEAGQIVGFVGYGGFSALTATFWDANGTVSELGRLPGHNYAIAYGLNELGEAVGISSPSSSTQGLGRAFLYAEGGMHDLTVILNDPEWTLNQAFSINTSGIIVGNGRRNGVEHAFVLVPVPEPTGAIILLTGAAIVWWRRAAATQKN